MKAAQSNATQMISSNQQPDSGMECGSRISCQPKEDVSNLLPRIIQGGMGVGVSNWMLARQVASYGELGVVSGTALDELMIRRLQTGDEGGHMRRALSAFPDPDVSSRLLNRYFIEGGKNDDEPFLSKPVMNEAPNRWTEELVIAANFAEVFLAKEGHQGRVGINYLLKIQPPILASLYGAMLAGVDAVLVGAGIPLEIPAAISGLVSHSTVSIDLPVNGSCSGVRHKLSFTPPESFSVTGISLKHPRFFPIISSATLASLLNKKLPKQVDGFIIEEPSAGGHNAPPRGSASFTSEGEPQYGSRDAINFEAIRALNLPFWLAGSYGSPTKLAHALSVGATGIQVGTLFAFCQESGLRSDLKNDTIKACLAGKQRVFQDPVASPTGFPFQVLSLPGTLSEPELYNQRSRQCDLGYLREAYERTDGSIGWRCPAENPNAFVSKGGKRADAVGRKCLCNGLMANIGLAQIRKKTELELPLLTSGRDLSSVLQLASNSKMSYSAVDVLEFLLGPQG